MNMPSINAGGDFTHRPEINSHYRHHAGDIKTIAAIWSSGVVFKGGPACSAADLITHYRPINHPGGTFDE